MKIRWPEAKFHGDSEFFVKKGVAPRKRAKKTKKLFPTQILKNKKKISFAQGVGVANFFAEGVGAAILWPASAAVAVGKEKY